MKTKLKKMKCPTNRTEKFGKETMGDVLRAFELERVGPYLKHTKYPDDTKDYKAMDYWVNRIIKARPLSLRIKEP